jgi:AsmA protein
MKIFKIVAAILAVLLLAGIAVIVSQFDAGRVKAEAVRAVADKTGRTLRIDGDLALSFWPNVGLRVGQVTLSEPRRAEPFAAVNAARVAVAVLPLLSGQVVVRAVEVDGLRATLIKRRDGSLNIDDLLAGSPGEPAPADGAAKPARPAEGRELGLEIAGIDITDAELVWQDEKAGKTTRISGLDLHTGRVLADSGRRTYAVSDLSLALKGAVGSDRFSLQVEAPKLAVSPDKSSGAAVKVRAEVNGAARRIDLTLSVDGFDGQDGVLKVGQLAVKVDAGFGEAALSGQLSSPLVADLERQTIALDKIEGQFDWRQPQTQTLKLAIGGTVQADLAKQSADGRLKVRAGETNLALKLAVARFAPLAMTFDVDVDQLNIDQYRPDGGKGAQGGAARAPAGDGQGGAKAAGEGFDFSALNGLDVTGAVRVGQLQANQLKLSQLNLPIRIADGRLSVAPMTAGLYDGSLNGALALDARGNAVSLRQKLSGINLAPLLADLADTDLLEGRGDVSVDLNSRGQSVDEMKRRLAGSARIALGKGAIRGIDLEQTLRDVQRLLGKAKDQAASPAATGKTAFSELTASFAIANGVARNDDLLGQSALLRLQGQGAIDIGNNRLDYLLKANAVTGADAGATGLARLKGVAVPVRLSGALDQPAWTVDGEALAGELAKAGAQEALQKAGKKLEEKLLEGLFKKK